MAAASILTPGGVWASLEPLAGTVLAMRAEVANDVMVVHKVVDMHGDELSLAVVGDVHKVGNSSSRLAGLGHR